MEKKNNTWLIVLMVFIIIGLAGYLFYDKYLKDSKPATDSNTKDVEGSSKEELSKYIGYWYESEEKLNDDNPNFLYIKEVNGDDITFDLYITRTANFANVKTTKKGDAVLFEAKTDNGESTDGKEAQIGGQITFDNSKITVIVKESNVLDINVGTTYTFAYRTEIDPALVSELKDLAFIFDDECSIYVINPVGVLNGDDDIKSFIIWNYATRHNMIVENVPGPEICTGSGAGHCDGIKRDDYDSIMKLYGFGSFKDNRQYAYQNDMYLTQFGGYVCEESAKYSIKSINKEGENIVIKATITFSEYNEDNSLGKEIRTENRTYTFEPSLFKGYKYFLSSVTK
jgi:hypothetical protein